MSVSFPLNQPAQHYRSDTSHKVFNTPSDGAFIQGYNAQAVVSGDQIVVGTAVTPEATDVAMLEPMITNASDNLAAAGSQEPIGAVLADAGYWSHANSLIEDTLDGTLLLIAPGDKTHKVGDPPPAAVRHRHRRHPSPPSHANPIRRPRQPRHSAVSAVSPTDTHPSSFERS